MSNADETDEVDLSDLDSSEDDFASLLHVVDLPDRVSEMLADPSSTWVDLRIFSELHREIYTIHESACEDDQYSDRSTVSLERRAHPVRMTF